MLAAFVQGALLMIRKLLLPALATALLAGCVTSGYQYRGGSGDYYYGQPSTQYRYYGAPYGNYGYGYPGGWGGSIGYGYYPNGYYPYGYYGYGGYPYYRHRYPYRPPVVIVRPGSGGSDHGNDNHQGDHNDRPRPPWRDLGNLRDRQPRPKPTISEQPRPQFTPMPQTVPSARPGGRSGSAMGEMVQRARADRDKRRIPTP
jgi:hypothetical protein